MKLDVVFVCQHGELEAQSCLLAASLRKHCGNQVALHVIEPIPEEVYGTISPVTRKVLDELGAKWYPFRNPISDDYKVFNKLNAFNIRPEGDRILFLDSDVLIRRPLTELSSYFTRPFAAKCGYKQAFSADEREWELVYQLFDLPLPRMRWPASDSHQWGPPYFNAAVIMVDPACDFSKHWIDTCSRIHYAERLWDAVKTKDRGTVQVGLPMVLFRRNIPYALLDRRFNFGLSRTRVRNPRAWGDDEAYIVHYGNPSRLLKDPVLPYEVNELVISFKLDEAFSQEPGWQKLLVYLEHLAQPSARIGIPQPLSSLVKLTPDTEATAAFSTPRAKKEDNDLESRMVFITGIPGAGAEQFAARLAEFPGVSDLNAEVLQHKLKYLNAFEHFGEWWQTWRKDKNLSDSTDVLATQHTLGYISRLGEISRTVPRATVFVMVRHPFGAIRNWMLSSYLREGKILEDDEWVGMTARYLSEDQREHLSELRGVTDPVLKRAGLWDYFALLANTHAPQIHILRYEDLLDKPAAVLKYAFERLFPGQDFEMPSLDLRNKEPEAHYKLTEWEKECIRAVCSYNAGAFGYNLYEEATT